MKLTLLFTVISFLSFTAVASAQRINISVENAKMEDVFSSITQQTGLSVAYSKQVVNMNRRVSLDLKDAEIGQVLDQLIRGASLQYMVSEDKIYLFEKGNVSSQQIVKNISGLVTDPEGEPIIGANVVEKGTQNGIITDLDGTFALQVTKMPP